MGFKDAQFYKKLPEKKVKCNLCPHSCIIGNGECDVCGVRQNMGGKLKTLNYGKLHVLKSQGIENFGVYHFLPEQATLGIGAIGENLCGKFYENETSGKDLEEIPTLNHKPFQIIKHADKMGSKIMVYHHGEPTVFYEYMNDTIDRGKKIKHIVITNGFVNREPIRLIAKKADAIVFDIRAMNDEFYEHICKGKLEPVLSAIKTAWNQGTWVEIKMMIVPGLHKEFYDVRRLVSWVLNNLDENVPIHFLGFEPNEQTNNYPKTDSEIVKRARKIAMDAGINYVYTDNINSEEGKTTFCPKCRRKVIIRREGDFENKLVKGKCSCGQEIPGVWS